MPPFSASATSGRWLWFSMVAAFSSESASTTPFGSITVMRTRPSVPSRATRSSRAAVLPAARSGSVGTFAASAALSETLLQGVEGDAAHETAACRRKRSATARRLTITYPAKTRRKMPCFISASPRPAPPLPVPSACSRPPARSRCVAPVGPSLSRRCFTWTSTDLSVTFFSSPQRWSRIFSREKTQPMRGQGAGGCGTPPA